MGESYHPRLEDSGLMFLIRSTFWLGLALVVLQPQGWNLDAQAGALSAGIVDSGRQTTSRHLMNIACDSIECVGSKALLLAANLKNNPSQASTMQDSLSLNLAPVPRPRPDWAG